MIKRICSLFILALMLGSIIFTPVFADDDLAEIEKKLDDLKKALDMSKAATTPLEDNLTKLEETIADLQRRIAAVEKEVVKKEKEVKDGEESLSIQQEILENRVRSYYKHTLKMGNSSLYLFSNSINLGELLRLEVYRKAVIDEDKKIITEIVLYVKDLEERKKRLESEKGRLAVVKEETNKQADFFKKEIAGAKKYQQQLGEEIKELTARQQELLTAKTGLFSTSVGDVPQADDPASRPDYNPGFSPAFAAFSFGAPHFRGMSQYGAFGRAKEGQSYEDILKAYYGNIKIETVDTNFNLPTSAGSLPFEDNYLKGIAEMPTSWADQGGFEALKAQAIAARSYALAYTGWRMGDRSAKNSICTTEQCQVYNSGKAGSPGRWGDAVNDTKGKIIVSNSSNEVVNSWYSSTSGGYQESYNSLGHSTPGFWDTKSGRSGWTNEAYEKIGGSPWFYKGWYKTRGGQSCGRSHPWFTSEQFADITNAAIVYEGGGDISGIFPEDVQSCFGGSDNPWSKQRLKEEADKHGGGFTSVSSVSVQYREDGLTGKIIVNGREIDGQKFYKAFNLRAPGATHLKSGLYNIEKK